MKIYQNDDRAIGFEQQRKGSWVRFSKVDEKLEVNRLREHALTRANVKALRKWLKKAFRKPFDIRKV